MLSVRLKIGILKLYDSERIGSLHTSFHEAVCKVNLTPQTVKNTLHFMVVNNLRAHREKRKITQVSMAKEVGVSRQTIHSIETGKYVPSVELALKISETLNQKVEEIFSLKQRGKK